MYARVTDTKEAKKLLKSLGIFGLGSHREFSTHVTFFLGSTWSCSFNYSTQTIEVNKTYVSESASVRRHNKMMRRRYNKLPDQLIRATFNTLIDWGAPAGLHDRINRRLFAPNPLNRIYLR